MLKIELEPKLLELEVSGSGGRRETGMKRGG